MDVGLPNLAIDAAIAIAIIAVIAVVALLIQTRPRARKHRSLALAEVQEGLHRTGIVAIEGGVGRIGLDVYVRNRSDALVDIQIKQGTVIEATDPEWQNMVAARTQSLDLPPRSTQRLQLDALSLDARKRSAGPRGEGGYRVGPISDNGDLYRLFGAVARLEKEVARHVQRAEGDRVQHKPMGDDLIIVATYCSYRRLDQGGYEARVADEVIQYALWQVTDGVGFDELLGLALQAGLSQGRAQAVGQILAANIVVEAAGIKPSAGI